MSKNKKKGLSNLEKFKLQEQRIKGLLNEIHLRDHCGEDITKKPDNRKIKNLNKKTPKQDRNKAKRGKRKTIKQLRLLSNSRGELSISYFLENNYIFYEREKTFNDLVNITGAHLRFDFYLPDHNLCIEFDGPQHFMYIKDFHGDNEELGRRKLKAQQDRDKLKDRYCFKNKIELLRISYKDAENIKVILRKRLKGR